MKHLALTIVLEITDCVCIRFTKRIFDHVSSNSLLNYLIRCTVISLLKTSYMSYIWIHEKSHASNTFENTIQRRPPIYQNLNIV